MRNSSSDIILAIANPKTGQPGKHSHPGVQERILIPITTRIPTAKPEGRAGPQALLWAKTTNDSFLVEPLGTGGPASPTAPGSTTVIGQGKLRLLARSGEGLLSPEHPKPNPVDMGAVSGSVATNTSATRVVRTLASSGELHPRELEMLYFNGPLSLW